MPTLYDHFMQMRNFLFLFLFLQLTVRAGASETVTSTVGQVGDHVITSREVWISNFLERWTLSRKAEPLAGTAKLGPPQNDWKPALQSDAFNQATSSFMLELMVALEAENFSVAQVEPSEVKRQAIELSKAMVGQGDWLKLEVGSVELEKFIERKRRSQNFLRFKTDSAGVVVSEAEAKNYFEKNRLKFANHPFAQFKESIKDVLARQLLEERLRDWFEILRRKYRVRFLSQAEGA